MFKKIKGLLTGAILGELVRDWDVVYCQQNFFEEIIELSLYRKNDQWVVCLAYIYKSSISYNKFVFAIPVEDLASFVSTLLSRYDSLSKMSARKRKLLPARHDRLPFFHRQIIKLIHGLQTSKLLLDHKDPGTGDTEYRFFGYVTRKSDIKVFIQSQFEMSKSEGHIISGEGFLSALNVLAQFLDEQGPEKTTGSPL